MFKDYAQYYNLIYKDKDYEKEALRAYEWAERPRSILELGCGTGKHARVWRKKAKVLGIDKSLDMLEQVKGVNHIEGDVTDGRTYKKIKGRFDCAIAMFNVMGYINTRAWWRWLPIKKGGFFIFDCWDRKSMEKYPPMKVDKKIDSLDRKIVIPERILEWCYSFHIFVVSGAKLLVHEHHYCYNYSREEIREWAKINGFEVVEIKKGKGWVINYKLKKVRSLQEKA